MTKGIEIKRQASIRLSSRLFCLVIFFLSAQLGPAQDRTLQLENTEQNASRLRVERLAVANGGELLTIWGRVIVESETTSPNGSSQAGAPVQTEEIPAQLKLLLSFNPDISNGLREQLKDGLERLSVNPLENSDQAERELAFAQYRALRACALRPNGLPARLDRQRSAEVTKFVHQA